MDEVLEAKHRRPMLRHISSGFGDGSAGRYAVIGVCGVTLDTLVFILIATHGVRPVLATIVSTLLGIGNNYVLNAKYNFRTGMNAVGARRFFTVGLLGLGVAAVTLKVLLGLGLTPVQGKLVSLPCVLLAQFLANKYWTFRPPPDRA